MSEMILIAAAVIPAAFLLHKVYQADKLEKEPTGFLFTLVVWGVLSTLLASITELIGDAVLAYFIPEGTVLFNAIFYFLVVALSEEGFKYLVLKNRTWKSPHFNCQFDGLVYAVFVSLGFALWENIRYVLSYGMATAIARAITAVPGHACFGVFMGAWYGVAKRCELWNRPEESKRARRMAVLVPTLLHGCYDFIASLQSDALTLVFLAFVICMFIAAYKQVKKLSQADQYIHPPEDPYNMF